MSTWWLDNIYDPLCDSKMYRSKMVTYDRIVDTAEALRTNDVDYPSVSNTGFFALTDDLFNTFDAGVLSALENADPEAIATRINTTSDNRVRGRDVRVILNELAEMWREEL